MLKFIWICCSIGIVSLGFGVDGDEFKRCITCSQKSSTDGKNSGGADNGNFGGDMELTTLHRPRASSRDSIANPMHMAPTRKSSLALAPDHPTSAKVRKSVLDNKRKAPPGSIGHFGGGGAPAVALDDALEGGADSSGDPGCGGGTDDGQGGVRFVNPAFGRKSQTSRGGLAQRPANVKMRGGLQRSKSLAKMIRQKNSVDVMDGKLAAEELQQSGTSASAGADGASVSAGGTSVSAFGGVVGRSGASPGGSSLADATEVAASLNGTGGWGGFSGATDEDEEDDVDYGSGGKIYTLRAVLVFISIAPSLLFFVVGNLILGQGEKMLWLGSCFLPMEILALGKSEFYKNFSYSKATPPFLSPPPLSLSLSLSLVKVLNAHTPSRTHIGTRTLG